MADKKKATKFEQILMKFFLYLFVSVIIGFVVGAIIAAFITEESITFNGVIRALGTNEFITYFPIIVIASLLSGFLFFPPKEASTSGDMKGKDELENQRFLKEDELDTVFKQNAYFDELSKRSDIEGWPVNAKLKKGRLKIHFTNRQTHVLVIGTTGAGKTVTYVEPTIQILSELKNKPSLFITDTKGELFNHHSKKLKDSGYDVKVLDLVDPYNSIRWNPLEAIYKNYQRSLHIKEEIFVHTNDPVSNHKFIKVGEINDEKWYEFQGKAFGSLDQALSESEVEKTKLVDDCFDDLRDIAQAICPVTPNTKEPVWDQGAQDYIFAVMCAMLEDSANPALGMTIDKFNFYNMYKLVMNKDEDMQVMASYFKGRSPLSRTKQLINHIIATNAKQTRDSFFSSISTSLSMFADNAINYMTSKNEIDFASFDEKPTAFFIKVPDERKTRYTLASIVIYQAYKAFANKARENEKTKGENALARPVYYVMDEFGNFPAVKDLGKMITISRSRRIYFSLIIQSYTQLNDVYGEAVANSVRGNCNAEAYIGTPDTFTREAFSKKLGNKTVKVDSKSSSKGSDGKPNSSTSTQYQSIPLIHPRDLVDMKYGRIIFDIFPNHPLDGWIDSYYTAKEIYKLGKIEIPYIPGRRFNEEAIFYDPRERNKKVLGYD